MQQLAVGIPIGGAIILTMLVIQALIGMRKIRFKGPLQMKVHRWLAWVIIGFGVLHGLGGLVLVGIIRI